jgi:hypothetical protein
MPDHSAKTTGKWAMLSRLALGRRPAPGTGAGGVEVRGIPGRKNSSVTSGTSLPLVGGK